MQFDEIRKLIVSLEKNISKVIVGKDEVIELVLITLLCSGHVLLEDVPGVGKTMIAKTLARSINCEFRRIQFTPDLLPSDLTGVNYYNQKDGEFIFRPGPIFANVVLADEINRATPRTQSSMLECMEERQVTIDGVTRKLAKPFFVIATQNPVEIQGTFPLPEAQLDRFFMRLKIGYPTIRQGLQILENLQGANPFDAIQSITGSEEIADAQGSLGSILINSALKEYILQIIERTRNNERISLGVSPRGGIALMHASQALAVVKGRDFVIPDDVKYLAAPVLAHRIILKGHSIAKGAVESEAMIRSILDSVPAPVEAI